MVFELLLLNNWNSADTHFTELFCSASHPPIVPLVSDSYWYNIVQRYPIHNRFGIVYHSNRILHNSMFLVHHNRTDTIHAYCRRRRGEFIQTICDRISEIKTCSKLDPIQLIKYVADTCKPQAIINGTVSDNHNNNNNNARKTQVEHETHQITLKINENEQ